MVVQEWGYGNRRFCRIELDADDGPVAYRCARESGFLVEDEIPGGNHAFLGRASSIGIMCKLFLDRTGEDLRADVRDAEDERDREAAGVTA